MEYMCGDRIFNHFDLAIEYSNYYFSEYGIVLGIVLCDKKQVKKNEIQMDDSILSIPFDYDEYRER